MTTFDPASPSFTAARVSALYVALLGRAADSQGLAYWSEKLNAGVPVTALVSAMLASSEAQARFGSMPNTDFVTALYRSAFNREPDAGGLQFWTALLANGADASTVVNAMLAPLVNGTGSSTDQQAFANRAEAALYFTQTTKQPVTQESARKAIQAVTADPATLASSKQATDQGTTPATGGGSSSGPAPETHSTAPVDFLPNTGTTSGSSDASTALALGGNTMLVGDDEAGVLRVYSRDGGAAIKEISYTAYLGTSGETDLEASARIGDKLYFVGSHGNNKSGVDQNSREVIFAATVSGSGADTTLAFTGKYLALEADLVAWDHGNAHGKGVDYFGFQSSAATGVPERDAGLSIEGMTFGPGNSALWLAFRAPATGGSALHKALIVQVNNIDAVLAGTATPVFGAAIELDLGGRGIRSIEKNAAGQYLIIAGPTGAASADVADDFRLYTWDGTVDGQGQAQHLVQRSVNLDALLASTGGSFETIVDVPDNLGDGGWVQLLQDNGDTVWSGQTSVSKDLAPGQQHFNGNWVQLGAAAAADTTAPLLVRSTPADNASGVAAAGSVVLTFNEAVHAGTGNWLLKSGGATVATLAANDARLSWDYNKVTFNGALLLGAGQSYSLEIAAGAIVDARGNAFAGLDSAAAIDFSTASAGSVLAAGDIAFTGFNTDGGTDAFAFVLLKDMNAGTAIRFTDKEWTGTAFNSGEGDLLWTASSHLAAGTLVTIQPDGTLAASTGTLTGSGGGLGKTGEQMFAISGSIAAPGTFIAALGMGSPNGGLVTAGADLDKTSFVPAGLTLGGNAVNVAFMNAKYTGPLSGTADVLRAAINTAANWTTLGDTTPAAVTGNQLQLGYSGLTVQPSTTLLSAGDVVFLGINTDSTDAFAFMVTKALAAGTQIGFTDRDHVTATGLPATGESAYIWTADQAYAAGTVITIQPDVPGTANPIASHGSTLGKGGGLSATAETIFAFQGSIAGLAVGAAGAITVTSFLGGINAGGAAAGDAPAGITLQSFALDNAFYNGSRNAADIAAFKALVLDAGNWSANDTVPVTLTGTNFFA